MQVSFGMGDAPYETCMFDEYVDGESHVAVIVLRKGARQAFGLIMADAMRERSAVIDEALRADPKVRAWLEG